MALFVIQFDCAEACIVDAASADSCWSMQDDLGCYPAAVYPLPQVVLKREPCLSEGVLRCEIAEVKSDAGPPDPA